MAIAKERRLCRRFDFCHIFNDMRESGLYDDLNDFQLFKRMDCEYKRMNGLSPFRQSPQEPAKLVYWRFTSFRTYQYSLTQNNTV